MCNKDSNWMSVNDVLAIRFMKMCEYVLDE